MFRSSVVGIGLAVAALAAFQVTGCSDSGRRSGTGQRRDDRIRRDDRGGRDNGVAGRPERAGLVRRGPPAPRPRGRRDGDHGQRRDDRHGGRLGTAVAPGLRPAALPGHVTRAAPARRTTAGLLQDRGPQSKGVKSETCTGGLWVEMDGCSFDPAGDYSCYKLPPQRTRCARPRAPGGDGLHVDMCNPCNSTGGLAGGMYLD